MKLTCPFCRVEYSAANAAGRRVQCVCCGHIWDVRTMRRGGLLLIFASICALLAASIFAVAVFAGHKKKTTDANPIVATVHDITHSMSDAGDTVYTIRGQIENKSDKVHGIQNLVAILRDDDGNIVARERFLAPSPVLGAGEHAEFSHTIDKIAPGAKRVSVEFYE